MAEKKETITCLVCGGYEYERIHSHYDQSVKEEIRYVQCARCGFIYMNPRPSFENMSEYYFDDYYFHRLLAAHTKTEKASLKVWITTRMVEKTIEYNTNREKHPIAARLFRVLLNGFINGLALPRKTFGRLLDVGCGDGLNLYLYKKCGYETYGIEINQKAVETAQNQGLDVRQGEAERLPYPDEFFDTICMYHVLEHVHHPNRALKEIYRVLKKDGELVLGVPCMSTPWSRIAKANNPLFYDKTHLYIFSDKDLSYLMKKIGWKNLDVLKTSGRLSISVLKRLANDGGVVKKLALDNPVTYMLGLFVDIVFYAIQFGGGSMIVRAYKE